MCVYTCTVRINKILAVQMILSTGQVYTKPVLTVQMYTTSVDSKNIHRTRTSTILTVQMYTIPVLTVQSTQIYFKSVSKYSSKYLFEQLTRPFAVLVVKGLGLGLGLDLGWEWEYPQSQEMTV